MAKKCPDCQLCLDTIWIMPRRFFHCYLCLNYYDIIDGKVTKIIVEDELKSHLDLLIEQQESKENEKV